MRTEIAVPAAQLDEFCRRWRIAELRVFGSAWREDFRPDSDLDLLVRFAPEANPSLLDHVAMEVGYCRPQGGPRLAAGNRAELELDTAQRDP